MARKALIEKNAKKRRLVERYAHVRVELKKVIANPATSLERKAKAQEQLEALPANSSSVRLRNRCAITGRPRGFMGQFKLSRLMVRKLASEGLLPGVKKASW